MGIKVFYKLLTILLGYGLIIGGFLLFGSMLDDNIKLLDIVVSCVIFTQFAEFFFFPLIDTSKGAQKEVGMMGLHFVSVSICIMASIAIMLWGIYWHLSFTLQVILQLGVLFLLLLGRVFTLQAGDKVEQVYEREQNMMSGKLSMKETMADLMDTVSQTADLSPELKGRLGELQDAIRFVSPSASGDAANLESQFIRIAKNLESMLRNPSLNAGQLQTEVSQMERILARRKKK